MLNRFKEASHIYQYQLREVGNKIVHIFGELYVRSRISAAEQVWYSTLTFSMLPEKFIYP